MEIQCRHCTASYNAYLMGTCIKFETKVDFSMLCIIMFLKLQLNQNIKKIADVLIDVVDI